MSQSDVWDIALAVVASLGGGALIVLAFSSWLGKVWAARILAKEAALHSQELERLKGRLDAELYAHRSLFDAEFEIYRALWARAYEVSVAAQNLEPWQGQDGFSDDDRENVYSAFTGELITFEDHISMSQPFYSPEIFTRAQELVSACRAEKLRFRKNTQETFERLNERSDSMIGLLTAQSDLCEAIRSRLYLGLAPNNSSKPMPLRGTA